MGSRSGGVATQKGINYQNRVAAWFCVRILAEQEVEPLWEWGSMSVINWLRCETEQPVDDLLIGSSEQGLAFINIKHKVLASKSPDSPLASVIGQFVRQYVSLKNRNKGSLPWERPLNPQLDRLVLVANSKSSPAIKSDLPAILRRLRAPDFGGGLDEAASNQDEHAILEVVRKHIEREWPTVTGQGFVERDAIALLRLVWVEILDVDSDEADERRAKEVLRTSVLTDTQQAETAWHTLIQLCAAFASEQSGGDRKILRDSLLRATVKLKSARSYRHDIELLRRLSQETLSSLLPLSQIKVGEKPVKIVRESSQALCEAAESDSYVVVGEPGAGKSGVLHDVVKSWTDEDRDVLFLAVDRLEAASLKSLRLELGLEHDIVEILQNWPGDQPAFLVVDALDAARSGTKEQAILDMLFKARELAPRWRVIVSIRQFDLRHNTKLHTLFRGNPHPRFRSEEPSFNTICHFNIPKLEQAELAQISAQSSELDELIQRADDRLNTLLRIPFNIRLIAELIGSGVSVDSLTPIRTQIELLERYWQERIIQPLDRRDAKELILRRAVEGMVDARSLRIERSKVFTQTADAPVLTEVLSANVLAEWSPQVSGKVKDGFLTFAHHVLFDYAVARLFLRKDPAELIAVLEQDPELAVVIRPSLIMHFEYELMHDLNGFWSLTFQIVKSPHLPEISKLVGPSVTVESLFRVEDFSPLIGSLNSKDPGIREIGEKTFRHVTGALMVKAAATKEKFVRSTTPDWTKLLDLATESHSTSVAYSVRPLLHILCASPEFLNDGQRLFAGRTARKIFSLALSQTTSEQSLVASGIETVCRTFESDPTASAALLRRCLIPQHVSEYGYIELFRFAEDVPRLIHVAPDLVEEIYRVAFTVNDLSEEKTDAGYSQIVALSSTRRQDYHLARWKLAHEFPAFLRTAPVYALRAVIAAVDAYSTERRSTRWSLSDRDELSAGHEEAFEFKGKTAFLRADQSDVWDEGAGSRDDEPVMMLQQFRHYLEELSKNNDHSALRQQLIELIVTENRSSALWRQVLKVAVASPQTLGRELRSLCWSFPFLTGDDTSQPTGELLKAIFRQFDLTERERTERAILSIFELAEGEEKKYAEYQRNRLLGCLSLEAVVTEDARSILNSLTDANQIPANKPRFGPIQISSRAFTDEDYLIGQGVSIESEQSQKIQRLTEPVKEFAGRFNNSKPSAAEVEKSLPSFRELYSALRLAGQNGIHERQQAFSWGYLASACEAAAKCDDLNCATDSAQFIKTVLLEIADYPEPQPHPNDSHFDKTQGWGSPAARIDAAQGLLNLAGHQSCVDKTLLAKIEVLKSDPVPAVRHQIASRLLSLYHTAPDLMWRLIDYFSREERSKGVLKWLVMASLNRLAAHHPDQIAEFVERIFERIRDGEGADEVRQECAAILAGLYVWQEHARCQQLVDRIAQDPAQHSPEAHKIVFDLRHWLNLGSIDALDLLQELARERSFLLMETILRSAISQSEALDKKNQGIPFTSWLQADQGAGRSLAHLVDSICMQMYFASGAFKDSEEENVNRGERERARYLKGALPILTLLAEHGHPHIAYHLSQTLEYLLPYNPSEVFLLIGKVIKEGKKGGYQYESMAADLMVKTVERFVAEYQHILQGNKDCRQALIDILDIFVDAGWPGARRLTYRMEEIFR